MKALVLLVGLVSASASFAQSSSTYDWQTGNMYQTYTNPYSGQTQVHGSNTNTGSQWNTTIEPNGNQHGMDSHNNAWNYDANTGNYINYGTGKMCFGQGANRICN